jgi:hypothetical protein
MFSNTRFEIIIIIIIIITTNDSKGGTVRYSSTGMEKRHEIPQSKCLVVRPRFESGTSQLRASLSAGYGAVWSSYWTLY